MAIEKKYADAPLQVVDTQDKLDRIRRIHEIEGVSQASVVRDLIDASLPKREALSRRRFPERWGG